MYISCLTADGAPNLQLTRFIYNAYNICLLFFSVGMLYTAFKRYNNYIKIGYSFLLIAISISLFGVGAFPMTINSVFEKQDMIHFAFTIAMFTITSLLLYLLAVGYLKQGKLIKTGYISLAGAILFTVFNLVHLCVILIGLNITGLVQRLSVYTVFIYIFILSFFVFLLKARKL